MKTTDQNFQVSGSRTKLYSATIHSKQSTGPIPAKISKLIHSLKTPQDGPNSSEDEITLLESFVFENKGQREFKQQYYRTIFYYALEQRLCRSDWIGKASFAHILKCFQCVRLLARESSLLVFLNNFRKSLQKMIGCCT